MKMREMKERYVIVACAGDNIADKPRLKAFRSGVNVNDRDMFNAGSKIVNVSDSTLRRLVRQRIQSL